MPIHLRSLLPLAVPLALALGCVDAAAPDDIPIETTPTAAGGSGGGGGGGSNPDQSPYLLGDDIAALGATFDQMAGFDATHHYAVGVNGRDGANNAATFAFDGQAALRATGVNGLVHSGVDNWFVGARLPAPGGGELKIVALALDGKAPSYTINIRLTGTGAWFDPCEGAGARVLGGSFTRTGVHEATPGRLTFGCRLTGVSAKCIDWDYLPGGVAGSAPWNLHQACTRMGRADICADGVSHTRSGTTIDIYDLSGVSPAPPTAWPELVSWPPSHSEFFFEAAWRPNAPALCLSRMRWQSLPLGTQCNGSMPDPRLESTALFCDHQSATDLAAHGALVFNMSRYNDLQLDTWALGDDRVATVRGYNNGVNTEFVGTPPFPDYVWMGGEALLLRSIPASVAPTDVVQVTMYENASGDHVLGLTGAPPLGFSALTTNPVEGWLFKQWRAGTTAFKLFRHPVTRDQISTAAVPAEYEEVQTLGYALISQ